jgi:predicted transposase YdaD
MTREELEIQFKRRDFIILQRSSLVLAESKGLEKGMEAGMKKGMEAGREEGREEGRLEEQRKISWRWQPGEWILNLSRQPCISPLILCNSSWLQLESAG